jgi:hypothetical protein
MTEPATNPAAEIEAIKAVHEALAPLTVDGRSRVVSFIVSLLAIDAPPPVMSPEDTVVEKAAELAADAEAAKAPTFADFADLHAAADPATNTDRALLAGYWLQVCERSESFTAQSANRALTNLGHRIANITSALDALQGMKPQLVLQLRKNGRSQQARKLYKLSGAGIKRVEEMIRG